MGDLRVISTSTVQAPNLNNDNSPQKIDLTPWDLHFLPIGPIQKGLLFQNPNDTPFQIHDLKRSLSSTLAFFPPFAGRLTIVEHEDNTVSSHIVCNNQGTLFVHAVVADNVAVTDILQSDYVPAIVHSLFPLNGVKNYEATSQPVLAVQVTELVDGVFIAFTINHVVSDGKSFWHFVNCWAEISRGSVKLTKLPYFERYFPDSINRPIRFPFKIEEEKKHSEESLEPQLPPERIFHFTKEKIAQLKFKANAEAGTNKISSLQALLTHLWRSVVRCKNLDPQEEVGYVLLIGVRPRLVPPLPEDYFGNAALIGGVTMKAGELLEGELGKGALEMYKMISLHGDEKVKSHYESWVRTPKLLKIGSLASSNTFATSSSPRFDVYGNDFGWGKPVAVRSGGANKRNGKISVFAGVEAGSIDIEVCLPFEILEALGNDHDFMDAISN